MIIQDPASSQGAHVDDFGRLSVLADTRPLITRLAHDGKALSIHSTYSATAADEILSFRNDDQLEFHVTSILLGTDTAGSFTVALATGTPAGTVLTGVSLNQGRLLTNQFTAYGNAAVTGLTPGIALAQPFMPANSSFLLAPSGVLILGNGNQICITTNVTAVVAATLYGYWEESE